MQARLNSPPATNMANEILEKVGMYVAQFLGLNITPPSFVSGHVVWAEKCGLDKNPKSETICLTFSLSRFRLAGGNSLSIAGRRTARKKHFKLLAFGLMLIDHVKRPIWIQTDIYRVESIAAFAALSNYSLQANTDYSNSACSQKTKIYRIS